MSLIHPLLPAGGRDLSIHFSPTRRHLAKSQAKPYLCVCCGRKKGKKTRKRADALENLDDNGLNQSDDDASIGEDDDQQKKGRGEIVSIPQELCLLQEGGVEHFACEGCLEKLETDGLTCPKCKLWEVSNVVRCIFFCLAHVLSYSH
jgi:hypothetical protein